jgi:hypothetical protein
LAALDLKLATGNIVFSQNNFPSVFSLATGYCMETNMDDDGTKSLSDVDRARRYRKISGFTRELDALTRKYGLALYGARVAPIDLTWDGPDKYK